MQLQLDPSFLNKIQVVGMPPGLMDTPETAEGVKKIACNLQVFSFLNVFCVNCNKTVRSTK